MCLQALERRSYVCMSCSNALNMHEPYDMYMKNVFENVKVDSNVDFIAANNVA